MNESIITFFEKLLNLPYMLAVQDGKLLKIGDYFGEKWCSTVFSLFLSFTLISFPWKSQFCSQSYYILLDSFLFGKRALNRSSSALLKHAQL